MFLLLLSFAFAEDLWAVAPAEGVRWPDVSAVTLKLEEGDKVEVLVRDGDKVRVRKLTDFGWVPASALTNVAPVAPIPTGEGGELPSFTIPGAEERPADETPADETPAPPAE